MGFSRTYWLHRPPSGLAGTVVSRRPTHPTASLRSHPPCPLRRRRGVIGERPVSIGPGPQGGPSVADPSGPRGHNPACNLVRILHKFPTAGARRVVFAAHGTRNGFTSGLLSPRSSRSGAGNLCNIRGIQTDSVGLPRIHWRRMKINRGGTGRPSMSNTWSGCYCCSVRVGSPSRVQLRATSLRPCAEACWRARRIASPSVAPCCNCACSAVLAKVSLPL